MGRRSVHRLTTTFFVVLSLLFSQLALANYVCPPSVSAPDQPTSMEMLAGEPCESMAMDAGKPMDKEQPVLCHQHCANVPQSFDPVQVSAPAPPANSPEPMPSAAMPPMMGAAQQAAQAAPAPRTSFQGFMCQLPLVHGQAAHVQKGKTSSDLRCKPPREKAKMPPWMCSRPSDFSR